MEITVKDATNIIKRFAYNYFNAVKINALTSSYMNKYIDKACADIMNNDYLDIFEIIKKGIVNKEDAFSIFEETADSVLIKCDWTIEDYFATLNNVDTEIKNSVVGLKSKINLDLTYCDEIAYSTFNFKLKEGE